MRRLIILILVVVSLTGCKAKTEVYKCDMGSKSFRVYVKKNEIITATNTKGDILSDDEIELLNIEIELQYDGKFEKFWKDIKEVQRCK